MICRKTCGRDEKDSKNNGSWKVIKSSVSFQRGGNEERQCPK